MMHLNCLYVEDSNIDMKFIKKIFDDNGIIISCDVVDTEERFIDSITNREYDIVISNYPNKTLNFLTLLGLYEINGKDIPQILLFFEMSADMYEYSKKDSGRIIFLNKDRIEQVMPKMSDLLRMTCKQYSGVMVQ